jgi:phosphate transport system ATP-binding protein
MDHNKNQYIFEVKRLYLYYGKVLALNQININIEERRVTALIGPSGCGKSTFLRCLNRMNDTIPGTIINGEVLLRGSNIYDPRVNIIELRQKVGMVFQKPNPFPQSIFDNVAFGPRVTNLKLTRVEMMELVEKSLIQAALWDEVKDKLSENALNLSLGQQQRLCIARLLAVKPDVILMDEPASALDPIAIQKIEELIQILKHGYTIVIVTHNMQQAARVSDYTGFFWLGELIDYLPTQIIFTKPEKELTENYITGRLG